jgi:hypothetical protein
MRGQRVLAGDLLIDSQGFFLMQERLSQDGVHWWPEKVDAASLRLAAHEL